MSEMKYIFLRDEIISHIEAHYGSDWSFAVNEQFDHCSLHRALHRKLAAELLPDLPNSTWQLLVSCFKGSGVEFSHSPPKDLVASILFKSRINDIGDCPEPMRLDLAHLASLSYPQQFSVHQFCLWMHGLGADLHGTTDSYVSLFQEYARSPEPSNETDS